MKKLSKTDIDTIESELGLLLPSDVREKYLESNGFRGPTGCQLLYTYKTDRDTDIIGINECIRSEDWFAKSLGQLILIGDDGCGGTVGYDHKINRAVLWYSEDCDEYQETRDTVTEIWNYIDSLYESET